MLVGMFKTHRILRLQEDFPAKLRDLSSWPQELQYQGHLSTDGPAVAIVGARAASGEAMRCAFDLAAALAKSGHRIISGGALGIDAAAHRGALSAGGYTMAIMACGLDQYYPQRNAKIFAALLDRGGAMVSPFAIQQRPLRSHFVRRNSVIAALSSAVIVVEASTGSGSLHTARFAAKLSRPLAAYPGSPGCEALLSRGVARVTCATEVEDLLAGRRQVQQVSMPEVGSCEAQILAQLCDRSPQSSAEVALATHMPVRQTLRILHVLELASLAVLEPGGRYLRSALGESQDPAGVR